MLIPLSASAATPEPDPDAEDAPEAAAGFTIAVSLTRVGNTIYWAFPTPPTAPTPMLTVVTFNASTGAIDGVVGTNMTTQTGQFSFSVLRGKECCARVGVAGLGIGYEMYFIS
jgi:hypothetical protein